MINKKDVTTNSKNIKTEKIHAIIEEFNLTDLQSAKLVSMIDEAERLGFSELVNNVLTNTRNQMSFITEIIIILQLYRGLNQSNHKFEIVYEPNVESGNPDLKVSVNDYTFWIQIKRLSELETDSRNYKQIDKIKQFLENIKIGLFYMIEYSEKITDEMIQGFILFITANIYLIKDSISLKYDHSDNEFIEVVFIKPRSNELKVLTLGIQSGAARWVSEEINNQVFNSLVKAMKSLKWNYTDSIINMVFVDISHYRLTDICETIFGSEVFFIHNNECTGFIRKDDGIISKGEYSCRLNYYVALSRLEEDLLSDYYKTALIVGNRSTFTEDILLFDKIIDHTVYVE